MIFRRVVEVYTPVDVKKTIIIPRSESLKHWIPTLTDLLAVFIRYFSFNHR